MYDIVIIGGGPAGLAAAIYAQRAMLKAVTLEKDAYSTGQIAVSSRVDNYPGFYGISGDELGEKMRSHAEELGAEFLEDEVKNIAPLKDKKGYLLTLEYGGELETRTVIFAGGTYHRSLGIKGEREFSGRGISSCAVCDGAFFKGKPAAVIGGGDTAFSDALYLANICSEVYIISRRDVFRAGKSLVAQAESSDKIKIITNAVPVEIHGDRLVDSIEISQNGKLSSIAVNGVFIAIGSVPNTDIIAPLVKLDESGYIIAGEDGITSADGIFAAGDCRTKKLRQVITAVADGANCVMSAEKYIRENR